MESMTREALSTDVENLREEQKFLNADLSSIQMRWHALREEKLKASSILHKVKKADDDLVLLSEENAQVDLDEKVLMQTGDAELEMRGRCSAGQKVKFCLVYSKHRNSLKVIWHDECCRSDESLWKFRVWLMLLIHECTLRIMEDRKGQENFQLIVITHDERFAQLIGQRQHAEKYYRVTKDEL
ncbi:hypothetical protein BHM03_00008483 [Ensete ventricosum]|nr:hypothetical protein BHM03_00008483 [Ensete ventricosum]